MGDTPSGDAADRDGASFGLNPAPMRLAVAWSALSSATLALCAWIDPYVLALAAIACSAATVFAAVLLLVRWRRTWEALLVTLPTLAAWVLLAATRWH